jgi:hypothetical protein
MTAGRPTDYNETILELAKEYVNNLPEDEVLHSVVGLADYIGIARSTLYEWQKHPDRKEFSDIVDMVLSKQEKALINKGLNNEINPSITKVMMTKHGWREGIDNTTNDKDLPQPVLVRFIGDESSDTTTN